MRALEKIRGRVVCFLPSFSVDMVLLFLQFHSQNFEHTQQNENELISLYLSAKNQTKQNIGTIFFYCPITVKTPWSLR